ncbi:MAG: hypothetical protein WAN65_13430 [Candidatus Sulfotelmatobacter sp.]
MGQKIFVSLGMCLFLMAACGPSSDKQISQHEDSNGGARESDKQDGQSDNSGNGTLDAAEAARQSAIDELEDQSYEDVMGSDECTQDCSGHNAGWEWAKKNQMLNPDDCGGDSESFIEGCKAYGEEVERRADESDDSSPPN